MNKGNAVIWYRINSAFKQQTNQNETVALLLIKFKYKLWLVKIKEIPRVHDPSKRGIGIKTGEVTKPLI